MHGYRSSGCCCCREHEHGHERGDCEHQDCCCARHEHKHHHDHESHEHREHHHGHSHHSHSFHRRFATRAERLAEMEEYLRQLQAEIKAVEEKIAELKTGS